ncbi:MAG TPA: hypothetical protein VMF89_29105 [Polyangiales bacterium]|nr:hypothetical protein [Polyangiales bacterium]
MGEFDYIEAEIPATESRKAPIRSRVYTAPGVADQARYALEIATKVVLLYERVFGVDYPLPKLD